MIKEYWMKNKKEILQNLLAIAVTVMVVVGIFLFWSQYKVIWFCDEIYSYFTANSGYSVGPRIEYGKWYDSQFVIDDFTTDQGKFFKRTIHNADNNVHPPIYYLTLHVMSLIMRGNVSKWVGLSVNLICVIGASILLYLLIYGLTRRKALASMATMVVFLLPSLVTNTMLIRMYCMLTAWAILYILLAFILMKEIKYPVKYGLYLLIAGVTTCGFLTQYYFSMLAVGFTAAYAIYCVCKKKWKDMGLFISSMVLAVLAATVLWKRWISQVFSGYRGDAILSKASELSQIFNNIMGGITRIAKLMFYDYYVIGLILILAGVIFLIYKKEKTMPFIGMMLAGSFFSGMLITHVTPTYIVDDRYFYMPTVIGYVAVLLIFIKCMENLKLKFKYAPYVVLGIVALYNVYVATFNEMSVGYIDRTGDFNKKRQVLEDYGDYPWVYYGYEDWSMMQNYYDFALGSKFIAYNDMYDFESTECPSLNGQDFLFFLNTEYYAYEDTQDPILEKLQHTEGCNHEVEFLFNKGCAIYLVRHK